MPRLHGALFTMAKTPQEVNPGDVHWRFEDIPEGTDPEEELADPRMWRGSLSLTKMGCRGVEVTLLQEGQGNEIAMARIYGRLINVTDRKTLPVRPGDDPTMPKYTYGAVGRIEGCNLRTGEIFRSGVWYAPSGFHEMYLSEVQARLNSGEPGAELQFAHEYIAIKDANPSGYSWKMVDILPMARNDPLASLRRRALAGLTLKTPLITHGVAGAR